MMKKKCTIAFRSMILWIFHKMEPGHICGGVLNAATNCRFRYCISPQKNVQFGFEAWSHRVFTKWRQVTSEGIFNAATNCRFRHCISDKKTYNFTSKHNFMGFHKTSAGHSGGEANAATNCPFRHCISDEKTYNFISKNNFMGFHKISAGHFQRTFLMNQRTVAFGIS